MGRAVLNIMIFPRLFRVPIELLSGTIHLKLHVQRYLHRHRSTMTTQSDIATKRGDITQYL